VTTDRTLTANTGLAKVAVQFSADTLVVNQTLVLRINICGENRYLRQARSRCNQLNKHPANYKKIDLIDLILFHYSLTLSNG
jgi:hypothetical protein